MHCKGVAGVLAAFAAVALCLPTLFADDNDDLAKAARSPYQIARFVQSHTDFDWEEMWKALGVARKDDKPCLHSCDEGDRCTAETLWYNNELDTVLRLNNETWHSHVFLRFHRADPDRDEWRFLGYFQPDGMSFEPEHKVLRIEGQNLLFITELGDAGSDVAVVWKNLFDLNAPGFKPALRFVEAGFFSGPTWLPGREVHGFLASVEPGRPDVIKIHYMARHHAFDVELGRTQADAVYTRLGGGKFRFDPKLSSASKEEIEAMYMRVDALGDEGRYVADFLRYDFPNLKQIAGGPPTSARRWLKGYMKYFPDTPQRRELQQLLTASPKRP